MRISILGESPADQIAVRILVDSILELRTEDVALHLRSRGWPAVRDVVPAVIKTLHFNRAADALVVVADSDDSILHEASHYTTPIQECRYCQIEGKANATLESLHDASLKVAVGLAVPAIEAWLLFPDDASLTESGWRLSLGSHSRGHIRRQLKRRIYGTETPSQLQANDKAATAARRLTGNLIQFEQHFPSGFGSMAKVIRSWMKPTDTAGPQ